jgi:hypothetical protein
MEFRQPFIPSFLSKPIRHTDAIFMAGSCFTEQISQKLKRIKFTVAENPHGILFNPISISTAIHRYLRKDFYKEDELFFHEDLWGSWDHHTRFSDPDIKSCLSKINQSMEEGIQCLHQSKWLILTLGSAFVYRKSDGGAVANCHKVPADKFKKVLLTPLEINDTFEILFHDLKQVNPEINVMLTISPVRHLRDGFIENNRSKAHLIQAVHHLVERFEYVHYFPSFELVMDDLRDYRFFAEDMAHPNYQATQYVFERFLQTCIHSDDLELIKSLNQLATAYQHKIQHPGTQQHFLFFEKQLENIRRLQIQYPYLDLSEELAYFSNPSLN